MKKRVFWILCSGLCLAGLAPSGPAAAQFVPPPLFEELRVTSPPPVRFGDAAWGDYDADGDFDLILTGNLRTFDRPEPITQLYLNDGDGILLVEDPQTGMTVQVPVTRYTDALNRNLPNLEDVWQSAVAWGDYDNDGDLDLLATGVTASGALTMRLYENVGGAERFAQRASWPGIRSGDLAWGDYDNDGDLDFVAAGTDDAGLARTQLFENRGDADFAARDAGLAPLASSSVDWGDYDADGDLDLLVAGLSQPQAFVTKIYRNDGNGAFTDAGVALERLFFASVAWGDYDADGDLDVLLTGARLTPRLMEGVVKIYRNDGGAFVDVSSGLVGDFENDPTPGRYQGAAAWGDYDNDGYLDFLITGARDPLGTESLQVYHNDRNDRFTKALGAQGVIGSYDGGVFGTAFWGDYDNDHDLDAFVLGEVPGAGLTIRSLRNYLTTLPRNTPPAAPGGLQADVQGGAVTLAWNAAADAQTPAPGLSYNLRVGTTPGGLDVVSPMAVPSTGYRLLPQRGNAGQRTRWTLRGLAPGTYFWSVQALDNSFKGSAFAAEGTFTIGG